MPAADTAAIAWWIWPIALFLTTFALGIVAVLSGVGGGVLFVPIVGSFFPFHLDFVRGTGLLLALSGALSAAPSLLSSGLASLRLAMPFALVGSIASIAGAEITSFTARGVPEPSTLTLMLGGLVLVWVARRKQVLAGRHD